MPGACFKGYGIVVSPEECFHIQGYKNHKLDDNFLRHDLYHMILRILTLNHALRLI